MHWCQVFARLPGIAKAIISQASSIAVGEQSTRGSTSNTLESQVEQCWDRTERPEAAAAAITLLPSEFDADEIDTKTLAARLRNSQNIVHAILRNSRTTAREKKSVFQGM